MQLDDETASSGPADTQAAAPPPPKRFKFAARRAHDRETERGAVGSSSKEDDLSLYLVELNSLPEETDALQYWHLKETQYGSISKLALDLVTAPSSQAYVECVFSLCGDLSARKRNRATVGLERRVFLKLNERELAKANLI